MARNTINYICEECGYSTTKWMGRCPQCNSWNTFREETGSDNKTRNLTIRSEVCSISKITAGANSRYTTGIQELDRVLGGGIVSGSLILLGGAPGIGKSTLILQAASLF